jgi:hypothetical protein
MSKRFSSTRGRRAGTAARIALISAIAALVSLAAVAAMASGDAQAQAQAIPVNTGEPGLSGNAVQGQTLTGTDGNWDNSPTSFSYEWRRCGNDGGLPDASNCPAISGATSKMYVLTASDVGFRIRFRVSAMNGDGTESAASNATPVVTASGGGSGPVNTGEPSISGTPNVGSTLTLNPGTWTGAASFAYQWVRCGQDGGAADGSNCGVITGATNTTYVVQSADTGNRLRVQVRASNGSGTTLVASNPTDVVGGGATGAPKLTTAPAVGGNAVLGSTLLTTVGTWTGAAPITYAFAWLRCNAAGGACALIAGQTKNTYVLVAADSGKRIRSRISAKNGTGTTTADSAATGVVSSSGGGSTTCTGSIPGAVSLPGGGVSIPVTSVSLPNRLIVQTVKFAPNPVTTRTQPFTMRVRIFDTRGCIVRDALVFVRSTPVLTNGVPELRTAQDGWATFSILPRANFPLKKGYSVQFFVRTRKPGDNILAGVSSRRLVQVATRA